MPSTNCTNGSALANKRAARAVDKNCCQVSMKVSLLAYNTLNSLHLLFMLPKEVVTSPMHPSVCLCTHQTGRSCKLFDTLIGFLNDFFVKVTFEKV